MFGKYINLKSYKYKITIKFLFFLMFKLFGKAFTSFCVPRNNLKHPISCFCLPSEVLLKWSPLRLMAFVLVTRL